jgi:hypothetical protein
VELGLGPFEKIAFLPPDPLAGAATKRVGSGHLFSTKIYMDHIDILLSKLGYSELVQSLKKSHFSFGPPDLIPMCVLTESGNAAEFRGYTRQEPEYKTECTS